MKCDFSLQHYRKTLRQALKMGFVIAGFRHYPQVRQKPKVILLRHDIDYLPRRALSIARIEKKLGIRSTYFVRVHGEYYHPFDRLSFPIIEEIIQLGHEIGLHSEARSLAKEFKIPMIRLFLMEKEALETIFDLKIQSA